MGNSFSFNTDTKKFIIDSNVDLFSFAIYNSNNSKNDITLLNNNWVIQEILNIENKYNLLFEYKPNNVSQVNKFGSNYELFKVNIPQSSDECNLYNNLKVDWISDINNSGNILNNQIFNNAYNETYTFENIIHGVGIIYVSLNQFRNMFQFKVTGNDIKKLYNIDSIKLKTDISAITIDLSSNLNPLNALVVDGFVDSSNYPKTKSTVKHDFIRKQSKDLFNTEHGTGFFTNDIIVLDELTEFGYNEIHNSILNKIQNANGMLYSNKSEDNIVKNIIDNMRKYQLGRFDYNNENNLFNYVMLNTNTYQPVPFNENDVISYELIINPASSKLYFNNNRKLRPKKYLIKMILTSKVNNNEGYDNVIPNDNGSQYNSSEYYYSYKEQ